MYASLAQMRGEGVSPEDASDERVLSSIRQATALVDRACGWFFEPRAESFLLSGTGSSALELPVPPIRIDSVALGRESYPGRFFLKVGAPVADPAFCVPKIVCEHGVFTRGVYNIQVTGTWGYTVPSTACEDGETPVEIQRATLLLARRLLPPVGSPEAAAALDAWRLLEERTRDQGYRQQPRTEGPLSGDPEIDSILLRYRRPMALGAA